MLSKKLRIAFMGTPAFSVGALEALIASGHEIVCVYTQPPRPKGRGQQVQNSPVHETALRHNIPVFTPKSLRKDEEARRVFAAHDLDVAVVAAYGLLLPREVLEAPKHGCLNIHASLLPRWRGASPIQRAVWAGDRESGISIMQMDEGLDTGPVISMESCAITGQTTSSSLHDELAKMGAHMIVKAINRLATDGKLENKPQDDAATTYAPLLTKEDGRIDWKKNAVEIERQIRALNPWPGTYAMMGDGKRLKILEAACVQGVGNAGEILDRNGVVACGAGALKLLRVQPDNARPMDAASAANGGYLRAGAVLS